MKMFQTLKDYVNYIPNCFICQKPLYIILEGELKTSLYSKCVLVPLKLSDGSDVLFSKNSKQPLIIGLENNLVIEDHGLFQDLSRRIRHLTIRKQCNTCDLKIHGVFGELKTVKNLPPIYLSDEWVNYTITGGKRIMVYKYHDRPESLSPEVVVIKLDGKQVPMSIPFDFSKFNNLEQLNRRLKTIVVFH